MPTAIKDYRDINDVISSVTTLLTNTSVEMGLPQSDEFIGKMSIIFSNNLKDESEFNTLTIAEVTAAFNTGVRYNKEELSFNIRMFYIWLKEYNTKIAKITNYKTRVESSIIYNIDKASSDKEIDQLYKELGIKKEAEDGR